MLCASKRCRDSLFAAVFPPRTLGPLMTRLAILIHIYLIPFPLIPTSPLLLQHIVPVLSPPPPVLSHLNGGNLTKCIVRCLTLLTAGPPRSRSPIPPPPPSTRFFSSGRQAWSQAARDGRGTIFPRAGLPSLLLPRTPCTGPSNDTPNGRLASAKILPPGPFEI